MLILICELFCVFVCINLCRNECRMERPGYRCMVVVFEGDTVVSNSVPGVFLMVKCLDTVST